MNSTSLTKPVDLQGLSLALAKTKADYEAQIANRVTQSDWENDDTNDTAHILNRPAIRAGEGENSVMIGQIEQDEEARMYNISFDYPTETTDTITFTTSDDLSDIANLSVGDKKYLVCNLQWDSTYNNTTTHKNLWYCIIDIDVTNSTIVLNKKITFGSNFTYSSVYGAIYYKYKIAGNTNATSEGKMTIAGNNDSHSEGYGTKTFGNYSHAEGWITIASATASHAEGYNTTASGSGSHAEGVSTAASGAYSHAEGDSTAASGLYSHSEGSSTTASGKCSHAENYGNIASGASSHAEGTYTNATITLTGEANALTYSVTTNSGPIVYDNDWVVGGKIHTNVNSFGGKTITNVTVEDNRLMSITLEETLDANNAISSKQYYILMPNKATGEGSHTEGRGNYATGMASHTEGHATYASGQYAHTEGNQTIAKGQYQHVQGKYNIADDNNTYADIVGNGTSSSRSNAYTLDWSGNGWYAGKVTVGAAPTENMDVATKQYVDSATAGITTNLAGLTDTTITTPSDGQVLTYDSTTSKWVNEDATGVTYSLSINNNVITLTGSNGSTSSVTLPLYNGAVTDVWNGGSY